MKKMNTFSTTHQPLTLFLCIYQKGSCIKSRCVSVVLNQLSKKVTCQQSWALKHSVSFSSHCSIVNLRGKLPPEEFCIYIYIYVLALNRASHMLLRKEKRKSSNAFSLMILFYKDMILYVCMMHLASKLSRAAPIPSCFWFSPLSRNFCLFRLISKKSTSSPQYCSCLPGCRTNWPHSKTLQLFFTFILSTTLQSISDEK